MVKPYIPKRGDVVWLDFEPQKGREIQKTRPALVISPESYNKKTNLALFMPITSQIKGYPFESSIETPKIKGAVLCDQIRSLDWSARKAKFICKLEAAFFTDIMQKFCLLID